MNMIFSISMNNLQEVLQNRKGNILNVFFTAGYPELSSTTEIALALAENKVDMIEIGMPYSDPLADGTTIQNSSSIALKNGMNIDVLFTQVREIRQKTTMPIILMGYLNQVIKYGSEKFLSTCRESGVNGLIIPDLPMDVFVDEYQHLFEQFGLSISFLVTPRTSIERIRLVDQLSTGFVYVVADNSITGSFSGATTEEQMEYFKKIKNLQLTTPTLIGFGITNHNQFTTACRFANGAIIGSEFIRNIADGVSKSEIASFVRKVINPS